MSIKLLQVTPAYKPAFVYGGPTMSVAKLCEALSVNEVTLEVFTTTANGATELPVAANETQLIDGVSVTYFKRLTKDHTHFAPSLLMAIRKWRKDKLRQNQTQLVIHIHAWWNLVSILSCQMAKWLDVPVVLSPRGMLTAYTLNNKNVSFKSLIHRVMGANLLRYCHIHATSDKEKRDILTFVHPKSITVIPNLVDLQPSLPPVLAQNPKVFKLLFLSRVEEKKGLDLLFDALSLVPIQWELTIAGAGEASYVETLTNKLAELGLTTKVKWLGHVNNENKFDLLAKNDLMVLTSFNENFANVVIESLSVGTPVLLSDQVGLADYVEAHDLGWISDLTPTGIAEGIQLAHGDTDKRANIRKNAPALVLEDFGSKTLVQAYISLYKNALKINEIYPSTA